MRNALIAFIIFIVVAGGALSASAAPLTLPIDVDGDTVGLLSVIKPESLNAVVNKKKFAISGALAPGVAVSIYKLNEASVYSLVRGDMPGNEAGLLVATVDLSTGANHLLIYVQGPEGNVQTTRMELTLVQDSMFDSLRGFASNFQSLFGGWGQ